MESNELEVESAKSIPFLKLKLEVVKADAKNKNKGFFPSVVSDVERIIAYLEEERQFKNDTEVRWIDLEHYLKTLSTDNEGNVKLPLATGFSYEVLKWSGLLEVLEPIVPSEILYALQDQMKAGLLGDDTSLATWGENPYILTLMACSDNLEQPEQLTNYPARIQKLDRFLNNTRQYCDFLINKKLIDESLKNKLFSSIQTEGSLTQLPRDLVRLLASKFFIGQPRQKALHDIRNLKNTCTYLHQCLEDYVEVPSMVRLRLGFNHFGYLKNPGGGKRLQIWMWGENTWGQLGNGDTINNSRPVQVIGLPEGACVKELQLGDEFSGCILESGQEKISQVWMWGKNNYKQLGVPITQMRSTPVYVYGLPKKVRLSRLQVSAHHAGCLVNDREVWMWGRNSCGQVGVKEDTDSPVRVMGLPDGAIIEQLQLGCLFSACVLKTGPEKPSEIWMWGSNANWQLGKGGSHHYKPRRFLGLPEMARVVHLQLGSFHCGCILDPGCGNPYEVWMWGKNVGILDEDESRPVRVLGLPAGAKVLQLRLSHNISGCILDPGSGQAFEVWTWGSYKMSGHLGLENMINNGPKQPARVPGLPVDDPVVQLQLSEHRCGVVTKSGRVWVWGAGFGHRPIEVNMYEQSQNKGPDPNPLDVDDPNSAKCVMS